MFKEFINTYGVTIIYTALTALAGYIGIAVKNIYKKYVNDKTKQDVVKTCVQAVEQIYTNIHGKEKYNMAVSSVSEMLNEKGITVSEFEIKMLIESGCKEFCNKIKTEDIESEEK